MAVFWDVSCSLLETDLPIYFRGAYCLYYQGDHRGYGGGEHL
jgi:hypothetical protein